MANRRMFALSVVGTDRFLSLPVSAQLLYFHLGMRSDDDGVVANARMVLASIRGKGSDLTKLVEAGYLIELPKNRIYVIVDFRVNNQIRSDRYSASLYAEELKALILTDEKRYRLKNDIPDGNQTGTNGCHSIVEERKVEESIEKNIPPSIEEIGRYCKKNGLNIDPAFFHDYYTARNWELKDGRKISDWKALIRTWNRNHFALPQKQSQQFQQRDYSGEDQEAMNRMLADMEKKETEGGTDA